jgi:hypothetical protein
MQKQNLKFSILLIISAFLILSLGYKAYSQPQSVRINEFLATNQTILTDGDGEYSDWLEISNPTSEDIDLFNWTLTDKKSQVHMWIFPDIILRKGDYLVVFASGKNRRKAGEELHTNFSINGDGEYLGLFDSSGKVVSEFSPSFPLQQKDISYGFWNGSYINFKVPTPGKANDPSAGTLPSAPVFSRKHGFYNSPIALAISSDDYEAKIYFTTDGSAPDAITGTLYTSPLNISATSVIRAVSIKNSQFVSRITTQTYLFTDEIIRQQNNPAGYPSTWGPFLSIAGVAPADYEIDPEMIADPKFANSVKEALRDLPVISLVTDKNNLFSKTASPATGGIYIYTGTAGGVGYQWERPVSFEFFDDSDSISFQADCGIQIQGGEGRRPEKSPKHSFRLVFKSEYGPTKLNYPLFGNDAVSEFNNIILRAGFGNTWIHWSSSERSMAQYLRDRWTKDSQLAMGHQSSRGIYVHLFINGLYWGLYNPSERMDSDFAESYLGGNKEDYDVIKDYSEALDGNITAWNTALALANAGLADNNSYQRILGNYPDGSRNPTMEPMVDAVSLADYMILNFYGGNWDWDHHNWAAMRNRVNPRSGFQFFSWDSEHMIEGVNANILTENNDKCPSRIFQQMRQNPEFRRLFADRVQKLCLNYGVLTPSKAAERWIKRADQIDNAVIAESARWGDYRRDVHRWETTGPFDLYTKEAHWLPQRQYLLNTYFPNRTDNFLKQLRAAGLFPSINGPVFLINDNPVIQKNLTQGSLLTMKCDNGIIFYTTDGSDPVNWQIQPLISSVAKQYTTPLVLNGSSHVKARVFYNNVWSATTEQYFIFREDFHDLKITEINYHPLDDKVLDNKEFEFVEIKNTGMSTLDMSGIRLTEGINYKFPAETRLGPKGFVVLASNSKAFYSRYGFLPYDEFDGQLDNNGETILLISAENDTLCLIGYENSNGWPEAPDGSGRSLVPIDMNPGSDQNSPDLWRPSYLTGGSPGRDDIYVPPDGAKMELVTIYPSYPNPFSEATKIRYTLHEQAKVLLDIIDFTGKHLVTLEDIEKPAGYYEIEWKGMNSNSGVNENGLFLYRMIVRNEKGKNVFSGKIILLR